MNTGDVILGSNSSDVQSHDFSASMFLSSSEIEIITILALIIVFVGVMANGLVIFSVRLKQGYFDNPTNLLLISQSLSDGTFCLVTGSTSVCNFYYWIFEIHSVIGKSIALVSMGSILLLVINRLISVYCPLKYPRWITPKRVKITIVLKWSVSSLVGITNFVGQQIKASALQRNSRYFSLLFYLAVLTCHVLLYRKSAYHRKAIKSQTHGITGLQAGRQADFKSIRSLSIVTMTFVIGWLPATIIGIFVDRDKNPDGFYRYMILFIIFPLFSSAINPFIYYFRSQNFRVFSQRLNRLYIAPYLELGSHKWGMIDCFLKRGRKRRVFDVSCAEVRRIEDVFVIPISER